MTVPQSDYTSASSSNISNNNNIGGGSSSSTNNNNDYSSLRYGSLRDNIYGTSRDNIYGTTTRRRSSQYDTYADNPVTPSTSTTTSTYIPTYTGAVSASNLFSRTNDFSSSTTGPRRYLATSKSSTNIYLHPNTSGYDFGTKNITAEPSRIQTRQQKTMSIHGLPSLPSPTVQPRMTGGAGTSGILPSSSLSSFHHLLNQQSNDWGWNSSSGAVLNHHHTYPAAAEPVQPAVSKGLGFWTNPSSLIPVISATFWSRLGLFLASFWCVCFSQFCAFCVFLLF